MLQNVKMKSVLPSSPRFCLKTVGTTFAVALALLGCTKKTELGSQVVVQLPIAAGQTEYKPSHFDKIRKIEAMSELSWGLTRPSSLAETRCFAVVVEIPAAERESGSLLPGSNTTKTCWNEHDLRSSVCGPRGGWLANRNQYVTRKLTKVSFVCVLCGIRWRVHVNRSRFSYSQGFAQWPATHRLGNCRHRLRREQRRDRGELRLWPCLRKL